MDNYVPSPASSDIDAYNTADARIHFGPLRSPEKKFYPVVACPNALHPPRSPSPLRRSPRLSTSCPIPSMTIAGSNWNQYEHNHANIDEEDEIDQEVANLLLPRTPIYEKSLRDGKQIGTCAGLTLSTHL